MKIKDKIISSIIAFAMLTSPALSFETVSYYHNDALGSSIAITDEKGDILWTKDYLSFGEDRPQDANGGSHQYTGQEQDTETGLYYYGARFYDPNAGRFLGIDPVLGKPEDPQTWNRYAYVLNNPYRYTDPTGMTEDDNSIPPGVDPYNALRPTPAGDNSEARAALAMVLGSMAPGGGEAIDFHTMLYSDSFIDRFFSFGSLTANLFFGGILPNYGPVKKTVELVDYTEEGKLVVMNMKLNGDSYTALGIKKLKGDTLTLKEVSLLPDKEYFGKQEIGVRILKKAVDCAFCAIFEKYPEVNKIEVMGKRDYFINGGGGYKDFFMSDTRK